MDEIVDVKTIIERMSDLLQRHSKERIFDKDVADALRMSYGTFQSRKSKKGFFFKEILQFCQRTGTDPMTIFFK